MSSKKNFRQRLSVKKAFFINSKSGEKTKVSIKNKENKRSIRTNDEEQDFWNDKKKGISLIRTLFQYL